MPVKTPEEAIQELGGPPTVTFRPAMANIVAGIIIGLLMIAGGGTILGFSIREAIVNGSKMEWFADNGQCLAAVFGFMAIGLVLAGGGAGLIIWVRGLALFRVVVADRGFFCAKRNDVEIFDWDNIASVQESVQQEYFPLKGVAKYAAPMGKSRSFVVRRKDGVEFPFDGNTVKKLSTLAKIIELNVRQRGIPWEVVSS